MIRQLIRNSQGEVIKGNLPKGHMNGLMLVIAPSDGNGFDIPHLSKLQGMRISAKFQADKTHHLITGVPLSVFNAMSNIENGSTGDLARILNSGALVAGANAVELSTEAKVKANKDNSNWNYLIQNDNLVIYIDLGSIYCENGNEFIFELSNMQDFKVSAYSISQSMDPFGFIKYDIDFDLNENYKNILAAWIYTETIDKDFQIFVESSEDNFETDFNGLKAMTQIFGSVENVSAGILTEAFDSKFSVPQDVWIKITNNGDTPLQSSTSNLGIVTQRIEFPPKLVMRQEKDNDLNYIRTLSKFQKNDPITSKVLSMTGAHPQVNNKRGILGTKKG